jgi:hypothetical protein
MLRVDSILAVYLLVYAVSMANKKHFEINIVGGGPPTGGEA